MSVPTTDEQWRPIPGWESFYEVSDLGRVRSLDRVTAEPTRSRRLPGRVLKVRRNVVSGRNCVALYDGERREDRRVHHLVLEAFVGPRPAGASACHNDGDCTNDRLENLRWDSHSANMIDKVVHGTHNMARRQNCPRGHRLVAPNLCRAQMKNGRRSCLACSRAQSMVTYAKRTRRPHDLVAWADDHYARIMEQAAA